MQLKGEVEPLCLKWTDNKERNEEGSKKLILQISGPNKIRHYLAVRSVKQLSLPSQSINYKQLCQQYEHLKGLPINDYNNAVPTLLIGINNLKFYING